VGIAADDIEKIFRVDMHLSTLGTQQERGSGLGMVLCKEIMDAAFGGESPLRARLIRGQHSG